MRLRGGERAGTGGEGPAGCGGDSRRPHAGETRQVVTVPPGESARGAHELVQRVRRRDLDDQILESRLENEAWHWGCTEDVLSCADAPALGVGRERTLARWLGEYSECG